MNWQHSKEHFLLLTVFKSIPDPHRQEAAATEAAGFAEHPHGPEAAALGGPVPAHELEPVESVVEGVAARQGALGLLLAARGHFPSAVVHLPHQLQPLPAGHSTRKQLRREGERGREQCEGFTPLPSPGPNYT